MKKIISIFLLMSIILGIAPPSAFCSESENNSLSNEVMTLSKEVEDISPLIKYRMNFAVGSINTDGSVGTRRDGIVTKTAEPLCYDFKISVTYNTSLYDLYYGIYKDDGTFAYLRNTSGNLIISAGTKFRLWLKYKNTKVCLETIYEDIFYDLKISSHKDVIDKETLFNEGIFTTKTPLDCLEEVYLVGEFENKDINIMQIRKNFYAEKSDNYWTTLYLSYADDKYTPFAEYRLISDEPITNFDKDTPIVLTTNGYTSSPEVAYALIDFNSLPDNYSVQPQVSLNVEKAKNLAFNPQINSYLINSAIGEVSQEKDVLSGYTKDESDLIHKEIYASVDKNPLLSPIEGLKEIYLVGVDENRELILTQLRKNYYNGKNYISSLAVAYKDDPDKIIARFSYSSTDSHSDKYNSKKIIPLESYYSSVRGYAFIDYGLISDNTSYWKAKEINKDNVVQLSACPNINNYLLSLDAYDGIIKLNKDVEHLVLQAGKSRSSRFSDTLTPLQFVYFTDVHSQKLAWERIVEYINYYEDYIQFAIHTGDYCGSYQSTSLNLYEIAKPENRIIYNAVGNHDTYKEYKSSGIVKATQEEIYNIVFPDTQGWEASFGEEENATYYYKDFSESGIRLIVLDDQQWSDAQKNWLVGVLNDAKENNLSVITASHMLSGDITKRVDCTFTPTDNNSSFSYKGGNLFEDVLVNFKNNGGTHIAHFCGHNHFDDIGYTKGGILNIQSECASGGSLSGVSDDRLESVRIQGTKSYDCFNVVSIDVNTKRLKIVRIGCNSNASLLGKTVLCYDWKNEKVISNY